MPVPTDARDRSAVTRTTVAAEIAAATLLAIALVCGGGPRGVGDFVVQLAAVPCLALGLMRWQASAATRWQKGFLAWCVIAIALGLLQLLPLPADGFARLPQRAGIAADLQAAGLTAEWRPMTLDGWASVRTIAAFAVFFAMWLLATTLPHASRVRLLQLAIGVAVVEALLGFAQAAAGVHSPLRFYDYHHPIGAIGTFANRNHFASLLAMLAPVALAFGVDAAGRRHRPAMMTWYGLALLLFLAAALTFSRAGFAIAILLMLVAMLALIGRSTSRARWMAAAGFAALAVLAVGIYAWDGLAQRMAQDPLDDLRWQYVRHGLQAARDYMPWGSGFGSFRWVYAAVEPANAMVPVYADRAHNDLLQIAVEAGIPGLLLVTGFVTFVAAIGPRNFPMGSAQRLPDHALARVIAVAVWGPLLHSLVDYPLRTLAIAAPLALMLSLLSGTPGTATAPARR